MVDSNTGNNLLPTNKTVGSNTEYNYLGATPQLGGLSILYKLTSRLRLGSKPLSLELRASTLVLELEWAYQSSGQPRESQQIAYSLLYRPQPSNLAVGESRRKLHSSDGLSHAQKASVGSSSA